MANKIKFKRGLKSKLPALEAGEPAFLTDTRELFVGTGSGNVNISGSRAATYIVAASNSVHKETADYICDGTADEVEINAAIAALPSGGGKVLLLEGTYNISDTITISKENATLEGMGSRNTILNGATINLSNYYCTVCNLQVPHINIANGGNYCEVYGCMIGFNDTVSGMTISGTDHRIHDNLFDTDNYDGTIFDIICSGECCRINDNVLIGGVKISGNQNVVCNNFAYHNPYTLIQIISGARNVATNNYGAKNSDVVTDNGTNTYNSGNARVFD